MTRYRFSTALVLRVPSPFPESISMSVKVRLLDFVTEGLLVKLPMDYIPTPRSRVSRIPIAYSMTSGITVFDYVSLIP